ncbi:MAG: methionyl-tRNA formyltransferase, partial [Pseudomonadota bacterium]
CLNGHASLLPRWRGAAPIQRAIMAGDRETGMMIMRMDAGLDTGPVALTETTPIMPRTTAGALHDTLSQMCAKLMVEALARLEAGTLSFTPQPDVGITYAHKIDKAEARIDWGQGAKVVQRTIQGLSPAPGAWCELPLGGKPQRTKILDAETVVAPSDRGGPSQRPVAAGTVLDEQLAIACGDGSEAGREGGGAIRPLVLQKAGSKPLPLDAFLAGHSIPAGTVLDQNDVASAGSTGPSNASSS